MNQEQELAIVRAYQHGDSVLDIIKKFKTNHGRFYRILKRHNVTLRLKGTQDERDAKRDAIIKNYRKGKPIGKISTDLGVSKHSIYLLLRANKVPFRRSFSQIAYDYQRGIPIQKIVEKHNLRSNSIVYRVVGRLGLEHRKNWKPIDIEAIAEDYKNGIQIKTIMRKHSISNRAKIRNHLLKAGIKMTRRLPGSAANMNVVAEWQHEKSSRKSA